MILVTGGTGFVGTNLVKRLEEKNYSFASFGSKDYNLLKQQHVEYLLNTVEPDTIIHLAASVGGIGANQKNPAKFMFDNLCMGMNLIDGAYRHGSCKKFIMLGTVCCYPKYTPVPFFEKDIWNGYPEETNAPYGIAKKTLAELGFAYQKQYGFEFYNLVPTNLYGPHDNFDLQSSHVIPAIIRKVEQAKKSGDHKIELWGTGEATRDFLYVDDLVDAIISALDAELPPEPINIGTGFETKIVELSEIICKKMDYQGSIFYNSSEPDGQPRRVLDISKAKYYLNFDPKITLEQGLEKTIEYAKHNIFKR
jgi:GDP-L-fucose synthase